MCFFFFCGVHSVFISLYSKPLAQICSYCFSSLFISCKNVVIYIYIKFLVSILYISTTYEVYDKTFLIFNMTEISICILNHND